MADIKDQKIQVCSFCGLPGDEHRRLIQGNNCFICETCIGVCYHMLDLEEKEDTNEDIALEEDEAKDELKLDLSPSEIYNM